MVKRMTDIIGSLLGLLLIAPFTPFITLALKIDSRGPLLVKLDRISEGRVIRVYKFRSMIIGAHTMKSQLTHLNERSDGPFFKIARDPRITRVGRWLRKTRIDEFPQLINVLRGELSLVGPRPHEPIEVTLYPDEYRHLTQYRSGVTGLSQINGSSSLPFLRELELDSYYVFHRTWLMDMRIIFKTIMILFTDPTAV